MPNFTNGKIYKLWSPEGDDIYIGSTVQSLSMRKVAHKRSCNNDNCCSSKILFQNYDDVRIELIEEFPCENKMELTKREGHYIRTLECVNKRIPGRTREESSKKWREANREKNKERNRQYRENNREKELKRNKKYREANKEKRTEYDKQYRENNKEYLKQKQRERYAKKKNLVSVQSPVLSPEQSVE
jgi:hypothetical protein